MDRQAHNQGSQSRPSAVGLACSACEFVWVEDAGPVARRRHGDFGRVERGLEEARLEEADPTGAASFLSEPFASGLRTTLQQAGDTAISQRLRGVTGAAGGGFSSSGPADQVRELPLDRPDEAGHSSRARAPAKNVVETGRGVPGFKRQPRRTLAAYRAGARGPSQGIGLPPAAERRALGCPGPPAELPRRRSAGSRFCVKA
jgi:hypothetical protein